MATLQQRLQDLATRISTECKSLRTLISGNQSSLAALTFGTKTNLVVALNELKGELDAVASAGGATINDGSSSSTTQTWSINKIIEELNDTAVAVKNEILGGAGPAYDTLQELKTLLDSESGELDSVVTALGNRLRFDGAQTLTAPQKVQGNANLGSLSLVQSGDPDANLVTVFETGLT